MRRLAEALASIANLLVERAVLVVTAIHWRLQRLNYLAFELPRLWHYDPRESQMLALPL